MNEWLRRGFGASGTALNQVGECLRPSLPDCAGVVVLVVFVEQRGFFIAELLDERSTGDGVEVSGDFDSAVLAML